MLYLVTNFPYYILQPIKADVKRQNKTENFAFFLYHNCRKNNIYCVKNTNKTFRFIEDCHFWQMNSICLISMPFFWICISKHKNILLHMFQCKFEQNLEHLADYSGALWATCPEFESHLSGEWEPYIPVIQSHLIGLYYIYFLYTVKTHPWCEYR